MKGYISIPKAIYCKLCRTCGARPIIALIAAGEYVVKCSSDDDHYQTPPGLIDIENWNRNNTVSVATDGIGLPLSL